MSMHGTCDVASNWKRDWQEHLKSWRHQLALSSTNLFRQKSTTFFRNDAW